MYGSGKRNNEKDSKEGEGSGGWASTFFKVAGTVAATAAVAGSLYTILKQPEANDMVAPYGVRRAHRHEEEEEVMILYVDGSRQLMRETPSAGCGGYLSSTSQEWIRGFGLKLSPNLKTDETEKVAILRGLLWVQEMGVKKVVVKSDCKTVVDFVNSRSKSNNRLICEIRDLLDSDEWEASLSWISRNENKEADAIASEAHDLPSVDILVRFENRSDILKFKQRTTTYGNYSM